MLRLLIGCTVLVHLQGAGNNWEQRPFTQPFSYIAFTRFAWKQLKPDRGTAIGSLDLCGASLCFLKYQLELLEMMENMVHHYASTKAFAGAMDVEEQTILAAHSRAGHYCGIRPIKLPNRRLAWPVAAIEKLFSASGNHTMTEA